MRGLLEKLNKAYFWDVDPLLLDEFNSKRIIIERVMNFGNLLEIKLVLKHYGKEEVTKTVCNLNYIDPKTLNFLSLLLNVPINEFKCYIRKQSTSQPWSY
ncbi:MAG: hypothetical protein WCY58_06605 [Mariniphaga sp.]|nr:hypothetical protein [Mariniphaga sp.]MDD4426741.1 hypothetical protein [Mariniphaga sp.]